MSRQPFTWFTFAIEITVLLIFGEVCKIIMWYWFHWIARTFSVVVAKPLANKVWIPPGRSNHINNSVLSETVISVASQTTVVYRRFSVHFTCQEFPWLSLLPVWCLETDWQGIVYKLHIHSRFRWRVKTTSGINAGGWLACLHVNCPRFNRR